MANDSVVLHVVYHGISKFCIHQLYGNFLQYVQYFSDLEICLSGLRCLLAKDTISHSMVASGAGLLFLCLVLKENELNFFSIRVSSCSKVRFAGD